MQLLLLLHLLFYGLHMRRATDRTSVGEGNDRRGNCLADKDEQNTNFKWLHIVSNAVVLGSLSQRGSPAANYA